MKKLLFLIPLVFLCFGFTWSDIYPEIKEVPLEQWEYTPRYATYHIEKITKTDVGERRLYLTIYTTIPLVGVNLEYWEDKGTHELCTQTLYSDRKLDGTCNEVWNSIYLIDKKTGRHLNTMDPEWLGYGETDPHEFDLRMRELMKEVLEWQKSRAL